MVDSSSFLGAKNKDKGYALDPALAAHPFKGIGSCICGYHTRCADAADHCLEVIKLRDEGYDGRCKAAWGQVKKKGAVDHIIELWEVRAGMFLFLEFAASPSPRHRLTRCAHHPTAYFRAVCLLEEFKSVQDWAAGAGFPKDRINKLKWPKNKKEEASAPPFTPIFVDRRLQEVILSSSSFFTTSDSSSTRRKTSVSLTRTSISRKTSSLTGERTRAHRT